MKAMTFVLAALLATPACARGYHERHQTQQRPTDYQCEKVRNIVASVGIEQAKTMALSAGFTESELRAAATCLVERFER